jgi:hypothetical protein
MKLLVLLAALAAPVPVTSVQLCDAYRKDPAAADKLYRDKDLRLSGRVREVSATYTLYLDGGAASVTAVPDDGQIVNLSRFHVGDQAAVTCVGAGIVFNEPIVLHCKL